MADPLQGPDTVPGQSDQTVDFLGRPAPISFKSQPALPSASGGLAPSTGPATTSGGIRAKRPAVAGAEPPSLEEIRQRIGEMLGGGDTTGVSDTGPGTGPGQITGFDAGIAPQGLSFLGAAAAAPGTVGLLGSLAGVHGLGQAPGLTSTALSAGKAGIGLAGRLGINMSDLTMQTVDGPVGIANLGLSQGLLSSLISALYGESQFAAIGPHGEMSAVTSLSPNMGDMSLPGQNSTGGKLAIDIDMAPGKPRHAPDAPTAPPGPPDEGGTPGPPGGEPTGLGDAPGVGVPE